MELIKRIEQWQKDRLLHEQKFDLCNENVNIVEELFESLGYSIDKEKRKVLKEMFKNFVDVFVKENNLIEKYIIDKNDIVDAYFDMLVFIIGAIMKLGYEPECVIKEGLKHINSRTGKIVDGKFQKDLNIKTYEPEYNKCKRSK